MGSLTARHRAARAALRPGRARPGRRAPDVSDPAHSESAPTRRTGKSDTAFRTIGEVAEDLDIPAHVLRFWESKFSQLKPLKRGGGRRYYRPEDIQLLRHIRQCLYQEGYTIRGVQKLLGGGADAADNRVAVADTTDAPSLFPLDPDLEPWQWPEEHWRKLVARVRAGRPLRPASWPGGARCAVALSFDSDHETSDLRDGGKSIGRLAWGQFGNRVGVPRILKLLERYDVKATFYVPAVTALIHPDEQRRIIAEGHEIGIHGWIHELNSVLPYEAERDLMLRSADTLEKVSGVRPVGLRTPSWDFSWNTLAIEQEMGLLYDSSLMSDEDCYELLLDGEPCGVVELPVEWVRDDAVYFMMKPLLVAAALHA